MLANVHLTSGYTSDRTVSSSFINHELCVNPHALGKGIIQYYENIYFYYYSCVLWVSAQSAVSTEIRDIGSSKLELEAVMSSWPGCWEPKAGPLLASYVFSTAELSL